MKNVHDQARGHDRSFLRHSLVLTGTSCASGSLGELQVEVACQNGRYQIPWFAGAELRRVCGIGLQAVRMLSKLRMDTLLILAPVRAYREAFLEDLGEAVSSGSMVAHLDLIPELR